MALIAFPLPSMRQPWTSLNLHYIPVNTQPYYRDRGFGQQGYPEADRYYAEAISLPMIPALTLSQQDIVVEAVKTALSGGSNEN